MKPIPSKYITDELMAAKIGKSSTAMGLIGSIIEPVRLRHGLHTAYKDFTRYAAGEQLQPFYEYLSSRGYIQASTTFSECFILNETEQVPRTYVSISFAYGSKKRLQEIDLKIIGDKEDFPGIIEYFDKTIIATKPLLLCEVTGVDRQGTLETSMSLLDENQENKAHASFYPWLGISLEEYYRRYLEAEQDVLLLLGPPGTAKSTFIRSFLMHTRSNAMMSFTQQAMESPKVIQKFYDSSRYNVLIYEDCELYLGKRSEGNTLMSTLLNKTQGIRNTKGKKIILSCNLSSTNKIDEALMRVGRCFDIQMFRHLTSKEAEIAAPHLGTDSTDFSSKPNWTIGEIAYSEGGHIQTTNRFSKVGFTA